MEKKLPVVPSRIRWNHADPSGYGVPGKPITLDQFYTNDVFLMLVPDDGLGPAPPVDPSAVPSADPPAPEAPPPKLPPPPRPPVYLNSQVDDGIWIKPPPLPYSGIVRHPNTYDPSPPAPCDPARVRKAFEVYASVQRELDRARSDLARARDDRQRQIAQRNVAIVEKALADATPEYEYAIGCTRGV